MNVIVSADDWRVLRPMAVAGREAVRRKAADPDEPERVRAPVALTVVEPWVQAMDARYPAAR